MDNEEPLKQLILEAEELEARARNARCAVIAQIRRMDAELSEMLDEFLPSVADQADWLFKRLFRREERPVDRFTSGRGIELKRIVGAISHGNYL